MKWADLSNEAQSILEWVEHVITGRRQTLRIKLGETFHQSEVPKEEYEKWLNT